MKCSICGYDESSLLMKKAKLLKYVEEKIQVLTLEYEKKLNDFKEAMGFSDKIKSELLDVSDEIRKVSKNAFLENISIFEKMEPKLKILNSYYTNDDKEVLESIGQQLSNRRKRSIPISWETIGELIQSFLNEPTQNRMPHEINSIKCIIDNYTEYKEKLNSIHTFFLEKTFDTSIFTVLNSLSKIIKEYETERSETLFSTYSITICPFCSSLFDEASKAAYEVIKAETRVDDDWDDDEEDY